MTDEEKKQIAIYRKNGMGYKQIATLTGVSTNTVKSFCRRNNLTDERLQKKSGSVCNQCGKALQHTDGKRKKRFCSDACRMKWWNSHPEQVKRKAVYEYMCPCCHKPFSAYGNANRRFCSHGCYINFRYGGNK